jgi:O-antigen biosynthesis protein
MHRRRLDITTLAGAFRLAKAVRASRAAKRSYGQDDWNKAVNLWREVANALPRSSRVSLQYAQALRRSGRLAEAQTIYELTTRKNPGLGQAWLGLGLTRKGLGMRSAAIKAFTEALRVEPGMKAASEELINYGARGEQRFASNHEKSMADAMEGLALSLRQANQWWEDISRYGAFADRDYHGFRSGLRIAPPPTYDRTPIAIHIEANGAAPSAIRVSLQSLLDQTVDDWSVTVCTDEDVGAHPVASLAEVDARICFSTNGEAATAHSLHLLMDAGTSLHPQALDWFGWAAAQGCEAVYCDHDHVVRDWKHGPHYRDPLFQPMYDPCWFRDGAVTPCALLIRGDGADAAGKAESLMKAGRRGPVAHIPLPLAARDILLRDEHPRPPRLESDGDERICVIIPTRDNAALLRPAVSSLLELAAKPDRVDIRIVSNRTALAESHALLHELDQRPQTSILIFDEPFNWSRGNNLAARACDADILLFLNDDTEMLTRGWDRVLTGMFAADPKIGAIGALLQYPQGGIQHAGIVMGLDGGGPQHEGRWQDIDADGPAGRWRRNHKSAAVTGAFMAMPIGLFEDLGGFDERTFAIAYNDIDMCLRIREAGSSVLYSPDIRLIHHESVSRGINLTPEMLRWDRSELESLHGRWGKALFVDPAYNPNFVRTGYPFDGYRRVSHADVVAHVKQSAAVNPWAVCQVDRDISDQ